MDRTYEELCSEVMSLDRISQKHLIAEIERRWFDDIDEEAAAESERRIEAYRRGEGTTMSAEESLVRGRRLIEEAKRGR